MKAWLTGLAPVLAVAFTLGVAVAKLPPRWVRRWQPLQALPTLSYPRDVLPIPTGPDVAQRIP